MPEDLKGHLPLGFKTSSGLPLGFKTSSGCLGLNVDVSTFSFKKTGVFLFSVFLALDSNALGG